MAHAAYHHRNYYCNDDENKYANADLNGCRKVAEEATEDISNDSQWVRVCVGERVIARCRPDQLRIGVCYERPNAVQRGRHRLRHRHGADGVPVAGDVNALLLREVREAVLKIGRREIIRDGILDVLSRVHRATRRVRNALLRELRRDRVGDLTLQGRHLTRATHAAEVDRGRLVERHAADRVVVARDADDLAAGRGATAVLRLLDHDIGHGRRDARDGGTGRLCGTHDTKKIPEAGKIRPR